MFKFAFHDGVNEVFSKQLLKNQFWKPRNFTFFPYFLKFIKEHIFLKNCFGFWTLKAYILGAGNARKINDPILKSAHQGFSFDGNVKF